MMQNNLAPDYQRIPRHKRNRYRRNNLNFKLIQLHRRRHLKGPKTKLGLDQLERDVLIIGLVLAMGLMLILVSTKVTNDIYQHQMISVNANISKYHNLNNNSRQKISDLQNSGRLQKVAHRNHLTYSSHAVRNVK